jgi:hypothetical protein
VKHLLACMRRGHGSNTLRAWCLLCILILFLNNLLAVLWQVCLEDNFACWRAVVE